MHPVSRRFFGRAILAGTVLATTAAVSACTTTTSGGVTTYTVDTAKLLSIITSIESGLTELCGSSTVSAVLGATDTATLQADIIKVSQVTSKIAANTASTVSLTVAKSWVTTVESAASAALTVLEAVSALLPAPAATVITAVAALLPMLEALIGAVTLPGKAGMTQAQAQQVIAAGF